MCRFGITADSSDRTAQLGLIHNDKTDDNDDQAVNDGDRDPVKDKILAHSLKGLGDTGHGVTAGGKNDRTLDDVVHSHGGDERRLSHLNDGKPLNAPTRPPAISAMMMHTIRGRPIREQ